MRLADLVLLNPVGFVALADKGVVLLRFVS
jgi:hypothetical protein